MVRTLPRNWFWAIICKRAMGDIHNCPLTMVSSQTTENSEFCSEKSTVEVFASSQGPVLNHTRNPKHISDRHWILTSAKLWFSQPLCPDDSIMDLIRASHGSGSKTSLDVQVLF